MEKDGTKEWLLDNGRSLQYAPWAGKFTKFALLIYAGPEFRAHVNDQEDASYHIISRLF